MEPNIQELGNQATQAIQNQYPTIQLLRDTLVKKFASTENPLVRQKDAALKDFLASPEEALHKFDQPMNVTIGGGQAVAPGQNPVGEQVTVPNVWRSPSQQRALYSREVANKFAPLSTLNDLLMMQSGGIEGILGQLNEGIKSDVEAKKFKFDAAYKLADLKQKSEKGGYDLRDSLAVFNAIKPSATQEMNLGNAQSGLTALNQLREIIKNDPGVTARARIPGMKYIDQNVRKFQDAASEIKDVKTRLRTGAALNEQEQKEYDENINLLGADPDTIDFKLGRLESLYTNIITQGQNPDLQKLIQGLTGQNLPIGQLTTSQGGVQGQKPTLKDPKTGNKYRYDSINDPDYISDKAKGWK